MHDIDHILRARRVMHRAEVAKISSRATLKRRIDAGFWWRPTYRTVAPVGVDQDKSWEFRVALAHAWPDGMLTGPAMLYALGRVLDAPHVIDLSISRNRRATHDGQLRFHTFDDQLAVDAWVDGVPVTADLGPTSVVVTALDADPQAAAWLIIDAIGSATTRNRFRRIEAGSPLLAKLRTLRRRDSARLFTVVAAAMDGCQSPGEIEVWDVLSSARLEFQTQKRWAVPLSDRPFVRSAAIYSDFWIPARRTVVEVDSSLHDHVRDVRRDMWLLRQGIRTLRIVGSDFFAVPDASREDLLRGLAA